MEAPCTDPYARCCERTGANHSLLLDFTGDTLFAGDIGRTDLYSGDEGQMIETLKLFKDLPHDLRVLPGHGPASTIGRELKVNPYLVALG